MNDEILRNIWENLSNNGLTDSDFETWKNNFAQDSTIQTNVYNHLKNSNLTQSSQQDWTANIMGKTVDPQTTDVDVDPATVSSDTDLTSESTSSGLQSIYKTVDWFGKEQDGQPSRDKLIEEWQNTYGKHGFEFKRDMEGIQIDAPNGEDMIVPYKGNFLGIEGSEGDVPWDLITGRRRQVRLRGEGDIQNVVENFINNNQDPEEIKRKKQEIKKEFTDLGYDNIIDIIRKKAEENVNVAYSEAAPLPINTLMQSKKWGDLSTEIRKELVELYGEGKEDQPGLFGQLIGRDVLETQEGGLTEYFQEEVFNDIVGDLAWKERENYNNIKKEWWEGLKPEQREEYMNYQYGMLKNSMSPTQLDISSTFNQVKAKKKEMDDLLNKVDGDIGSLSPSDLTVYKRLANEAKTLQQKGEDDLANYDSDPLTAMFNFADGVRVDRNYLEGQGWTEKDIEKLLQSAQDGTVGEDYPEFYNGNDDKNAQIKLLLDQIEKADAGDEMIIVEKGIKDYLIDRQIFDDVSNNTHFDLMKSDKFSLMWTDPDFIKAMKENNIKLTTDDKGTGYRNIPLQVLEKLLPNIKTFEDYSKQFGEAIKEVDTEEVLGFNNQPINLEQAANFVRSMQIGRNKLEARKMGIIDVGMMNIDPSSIERWSWKDLFNPKKGGMGMQGAWEGINKIEPTAKVLNGMFDDNRITNAESFIDDIQTQSVIDSKKEGVPPVRFRRTKKEEENFKRSFFEDLSYGGGAMVPIVGEFAFTSAMTAGLGTAPGLMKFFGTTGNIFKGAKPLIQYGARGAKGSRYSKTYLTAEQVAEKAGASGIKITEGIHKGKTFSSLYKIDPKAAIKAYKNHYKLSIGGQGWARNSAWVGLNIMREEANIGIINTVFDEEMPLGMGGSFWVGGRLANTMMKSWKFKPGSKYAGLNPLIEKHPLGGIGFALASEGALPIEGLFNDMRDNKSWRRHIEENYESFGGIGNRMLHNVLLGAGLGFQHHFGKRGLDFRVSAKAKEKFQMDLSRDIIKWDKQQREALKKGDFETVEKLELDIQKAQELFMEAGHQIKQNFRVSEHLNLPDRKIALEKNLKSYLKDYREQNDGVDQFTYKIVKPTAKNRKGIKKGNRHQINYRDADGKKLKVPEIIFDITKIEPGEMPHEIFHAVTEMRFERFDGFQLKDSHRRAVEKFVEKRYKQHFGVDKDGKSKSYKEVIEEAYKDQPQNYSKEWHANLVQMLSSEKFKGVFVEQGLLGDIGKLMDGLRDNVFKDTKLGKTMKKKFGADFAPKYNTGEKLVQLLSKWANNTGKGKYDAKLEKKILDMYQGTFIGKDGTIKNEKGKQLNHSPARELYNRKNELDNKVINILKNKSKHPDWKSKVVDYTREGEEISRKLDPEIEKLQPEIDPVKAKEFENKVQEIFNSKLKDLDTKAWEIAQEYNPIQQIDGKDVMKPTTAGGKRIKNELAKYKTLPDYKMLEPDIVSEILYGPRGIRDMVKKYDPNNKLGPKGETVPVSGYIGSILSKRGVSEQVGKFIPEGSGFKVGIENLDYMVDETAGTFDISMDVKKDIDIDTGKKVDIIGKIRFPNESVIAIENAVTSKGIKVGDKLVKWEDISYETWKSVLPELTIEAMGGKGWSGKVAKTKIDRLVENLKDIYTVFPDQNVVPSGEFAGLKTGVTRLITDKETKKPIFYTDRIVNGEKVRAESTLSAKEGGAGNTIKDKIKFNRSEVLDKFGLSIDSKGNINTSRVLAKQDGAYTKAARKHQLRIDAAIEVLAGAVNNQIVKRAMTPKAEGGKGIVKPELKIGSTINTLINQVGSGRSRELASRIVDHFQEHFGIPYEAAIDVFQRYAYNPKSLDRKYFEFLNKFDGEGIFKFDGFKSLLASMELQALYAKAKGGTNFAKEARNIKFETLPKEVKTKLKELGITEKDVKDLDIKSAFSTESKNNRILVDVPKLENIFKNQLEFAKKLPPILAKHLGVFDALNGLHVRTSGMGIGPTGSVEVVNPQYNPLDPKSKKKIKKRLPYISTETGKPINLKDTWFRGQADPLSARQQILKNLGKNVDPIWEKLFGKDLSGLFKFKKGESQNKAQEKIYKAKTDVEKLKIALENFSKLENKTKEDVHYALEVTKQNWLYDTKIVDGKEVSGISNKKEFLNRAGFVYNLARFNSNTNNGTRQFVPVMAVYFGEGKVTSERAKLEHVKASATQSVQSANLIVGGRYKTMGRELLKEFIGLESIKENLDLIDKRGGLTNTSGLARMALLAPAELKKYRTVESGFKETLYDHLIKKVAKEVKLKYNEAKQPHFMDAIHDYLFNNSKVTELVLKDAVRNKKQEKILYEKNRKLLKNEGILGARKLSHSQIISEMKNIDQARREGKKKIKKSTGMSTWDFDDTLAYTKGGVRAKIPNTDGLPKPNRKVIFLAGGAGSGKGNVIKKLGLEKDGFKIVNQDISLEWLKKNHGLPENMNELTKAQRSTLGKLQHQARQIAKDKMMKYKGNAEGVVVDGTGGSMKAMEKLVKEFKDKGYDVSMLFVETSLKTALERNRARKERSLLDKIVERNHESVQANKSGFKTMFAERFMEVKTDKLKQEDAMPSKLVREMNDFVSSYEKIRLDAEQFASQGKEILDRGGKFDFSEFDVVTSGEKGPFFQKALNRVKKYGPKNNFVLTARPPEAAKHIHEFLKSQGLNIPLENIKGLGNSTAEAKAMWMLKKFSEGYNDMYFADDAMQNVKAVRDVLAQLDVKSKVQQALAARDLNHSINKIMEHALNIDAKKIFSKAEAKVRGKDIKRRRYLMRDSAADLELLIEPLYGKGKEGIKNKKWFNENFIMPWEKGIRDYNTARQNAKNDYMNLRKQNKDVVKEINKEVEGTAFTNDMAMRVYLWNKAGYKIPGLAKTTEAKLVEHIRNNPKLQTYADNFAKITKQEKGLREPGENWWAETMAGEITNLNRGVSRKQYLQEFIDIKNEIFSEANLNKMESKLGTIWRENITDMFDRMETGRTRSLKLDRGSAAMMNYLNGGIGTIMNFNTRSALLQTISTANFLNMRENNPIAAAKAMGNVKQFVKDFKHIMNSDMLKQRRQGLEMNVTEAELASAATSSRPGFGNMMNSMISKVLKHGYLPTKMADSFAIAFGGATFYRNRIKMYEKQGMKTREAEKQAWLDFQVLAERTQQSSRADLLSKQQTSLVGRFILPFANTLMQMNRAGMKDILDLSKGRYKNKVEAAEKAGRATYYMGVQLAVFAGLQSALFAMLLNDDDVTDEKIASTKWYTLHNITDGMLRGFGIPGAVLSGLKNATIEQFKQSERGYSADYSEVAEDLLNISPPLGSKFGSMDRAGDLDKWAKIKGDDKFKFELGNPSLEAALLRIQAITNAPVYAPYQNMTNLKHAMSNQYEIWQRVHMVGGYTPWSVGVEFEKKKKKKSVYTL